MISTKKTNELNIIKYSLNGNAVLMHLHLIALLHENYTAYTNVMSTYFLTTKQIVPAQRIASTLNHSSHAVHLHYPPKANTAARMIERRRKGC